MSFLTTIASALKGGGPSRVPLARSFVSPWALAFDGGGRPAFDYATALQEGFVGNPVAQRAVRIVAEGVGSAPLADAEPELVALVTATSAGQSLVETVAAHLLLHGNAYVQVMKDGRGRPAELFALRP
jgi:phage portal protein BeeE